MWIQQERLQCVPTPDERTIEILTINKTYLGFLVYYPEQKQWYLSLSPSTQIASDIVQQISLKLGELNNENNPPGDSEGDNETTDK